MKKFKIKSFCKINLSLRVLKKLKSNYHNIKSLITFCDLHDVISISKIKGRDDNITFSGKFKEGINKESNTVTEVLGLLRKKNFLKKQTFKIDIQKNIPHGSGLGGGSSNASNLLNFFNSKMSLKMNKFKMYEIAKQIGFDVPISLERKNTLLTGNKGEIVRLKHKFRLNILIVYPNIVCSTKKIYANYKTFNFTQPQSNFNIDSRKKLIIFLKNEKNDLQKIVIKFYPKVGKIIDLIESRNDCCFSRITGSGSACIGIFSHMESAIFTQKLIKSKFPNYWSVVSRTI